MKHMNTTKISKKQQNIQTQSNEVEAIQNDTVEETTKTSPLSETVQAQPPTSEQAEQESANEAADETAQPTLLSETTREQPPAASEQAEQEQTSEAANETEHPLLLSETVQAQPPASELAQQDLATDTAEEVAETSTPTAAPTDDLQQSIDEVDATLAEFLASANFVAGNAGSAARQANAILAVVNHNNGKRTKVKKEVLQKLNVQVGDFIQVTVKNQQVILLKSATNQGIELKKGDYLYNSELVEAITEEFAFDFSNQSTHHLLNVTYKVWNNQVIAIIT